MTEQLHGRVLVVDDNENNRDVLVRRLQRQGLVTEQADNGVTALEWLRRESFDLVLLDIMMPLMNGYQVLETMKADPALRRIPVLVISAVDEISSVVRCIELGAEDYLPKPFNPVLLKARVGACLEKKHLRDQEQVYLRQIEAERERSERLLLNILPRVVADRLKDQQQVIADNFEAVTVLFADIVQFTELSSAMEPYALVTLLNEVFTGFDRLAEAYQLEKIKTIGDAYMVVGGLPVPRDDHAAAIADMALEMQTCVSRFGHDLGHPLALRVGIHTGPVIAGVIGTTKFIYDLWGDTVNTASRMESHGLPGMIQVTADFYTLLRDRYAFEPRGTVPIKGKGMMETYFLVGKR